MKRLLSLLALGGCSSAGPPAAPVIAASAMPPIHEPPPAAEAAESEPCEHGFAEVSGAEGTVRYTFGRELVASKRGAKHAFVEQVVHSKTYVVLHLESLAQPDGREGLLSISVNNFKEPKSLPATFDHARVYYVPPGRTSAQDDSHNFETRLELTSWADEGGWVEGTFAHANTRGRFRVCRTADWSAYKK
jgi:hypothetical protein